MKPLETILNDIGTTYVQRVSKPKKLRTYIIVTKIHTCISLILCSFLQMYVCKIDNQYTWTKLDLQRVSIFFIQGRT